MHAGEEEQNGSEEKPYDKFKNELRAAGGGAARVLPCACRRCPEYTERLDGSPISILNPFLARRRAATSSS